MKKYLITSGITTLIGIILFLYFYPQKNFNKNEAMLAARLTFVILFGTLIPLPVWAKGHHSADAFQNQAQQHRLANQKGYFSTKNSPDDNNPNPSSEINSDLKENRPKAPSKNYEHLMYKKKATSADSSDDEEYCMRERVLHGFARDGTIIRIKTSQVRDKGLHLPDFVTKEILETKFDVSQVKNLPYQDRLTYLRNRANLPDEIVETGAKKVLEFMTADDTILIPGHLGYERIDGTVFINLKLNKVGFRDNNSYEYRTAMNMTPEKIRKLANNDFHLFPNAGKPNT